MRGETRPRWLVLLGLVLVVSACGEGEEPKPDGLLIGPAHQSLAIAPGGVVPVHVSLERTGKLTGAILVTSSAGPAGVTAESLVLTADESEGELVFQATELAEVGARGRVLVFAQSGSEAYSATVDVEVVAPVAVELQSVSPKVMQTQPAQVKVGIKRAGGFQGPVRLALQGPPPGILVETQELTLESGTTSATFSLSTHYMTPVAKNPLTFTATAGRFSASASTFLEVTRVPGTWDNSLGQGGWLSLPSGQQISSLVVQPDGGFVVASGNGNSNERIHIRRFKINGSLDTAFGQQGIVELTGSTRASYTLAPKMALQPDGKVLVLDSSGQEVFLYRLRADGTLDTSFGNDGRAILYFDRSPSSTEMALLPDGGILLATRQYAQLECLWLSAAGVVDASHVVSGRVLLPDAGLQSDSALGLFIDAQGRAVLATGYRDSDTSTGGLRAFRLTHQGVADTTFGTSGQRTYSLSPDFKANAFSRLGDGFVALGRVAKDYSTPGEQWLVRLGEQSGTLEYQWKSEGIAWSTSDRALTTLSDGRIMTIMSTGLIRLLPTGEVDTSFQTEPFFPWTLFTGPGDVVYFVSNTSIRRLLPPR